MDSRKQRRVEARGVLPEYHKLLVLPTIVQAKGGGAFLTLKSGRGQFLPDERDPETDQEKRAQRGVRGEGGMALTAFLALADAPAEEVVDFARTHGALLLCRHGWLKAEGPTCKCWKHPKGPLAPALMHPISGYRRLAGLCRDVLTVARRIRGKPGNHRISGKALVRGTGQTLDPDAPFSLGAYLGLGAHKGGDRGPVHAVREWLHQTLGELSEEAHLRPLLRWSGGGYPQLLLGSEYTLWGVLVAELWYHVLGRGEVDSHDRAEVCHYCEVPFALKPGQRRRPAGVKPCCGKPGCLRIKGRESMRESRGQK